MLAPDQSPIHHVILAVRRLGPITPGIRGSQCHALWRATIWTAAAAEKQIQDSHHVVYNPSDDARVKWLLEWADVLEGSRRRIDSRLTDTMEFLCRFSAPRLCGKDYAAGECEPLTLAQGS